MASASRRKEPFRSPSSASRDTNGGRKTSMSMSDLSTNVPTRSASAASHKHSRPISAASLSESLQALSSSPEPHGRSGSRQRSRTLTEVLDDESTGRASPLVKNPSKRSQQFGSSSDDVRPGRSRAFTDSSIPSTGSPAMHAKSRQERMAGASVTPQHSIKQIPNFQRFNPLSNSPHFTRNPLFTTQGFMAPGASHSPATLQRQRIAVEAGYTPQDSPYTAHKAMHAPLSPSIWGTETLARFQSMPVLGQGNVTSVGQSSPQLPSGSPGRHHDLQSTSGLMNQSTHTLHRYGPTVLSPAQRVTAGQRCKCPPDPALVPGFSLLEIT